jgi:UDP-3-O-[3-hydroxymyristoyl] glucosamine N-acyltransferase
MPNPKFFKNVGPFTLGKLAEIGKAEISAFLPKGVDRSTVFQDVSSLENAGPKDVAVLHNAKYVQDLKDANVGLCILDPVHAKYAGEGTALLLSKTPYRSYALIAAAFYPDSFNVDFTTGDANTPKHPSAIIGKDCIFEPGVIIGPEAQIGDNVYIGANTVIGQGVTIGEKTKIAANVTISHAKIGSHCVIYPGARIGQAGFGFFMDEAGHIQVPQLGCVLIGDGVEIGSNTTIDRGSSNNTVIESGCRIDNLVQIAHNVHLGKGCVIVAQVGISGSTSIGDFSAIAGQAGIIGHLKIGRGVQVAAQSGVMRNIEDGMIVGGSPAVPAKQWHRQTVALERLARPNKTRDTV